jgi:pre-mRNA-processing factor 19
VNPTQFLTGGNDGIVQLYDRGTDKVLASLKGHSKKIHHVAFREREGQPTLLLSAGADKLARVWSSDSASGEYRPRTIIKTHKSDVTGLAVHPTSTLLFLASQDKTYSIHDHANSTSCTAPLPQKNHIHLVPCTRTALFSL